MTPCGRTAPSTTGYPHPGTLLSGLVAWLDVRSRGGRFVLRLEDLDPGRSRGAYVVALGNVFDWLGLSVDLVERQSRNAARYAEVLDALARRKLLYACDCSRARLRHLVGADKEVGTAAYDNHCRERTGALTAEGWREATGTVRLRLAQQGGVQALGPATQLGDPIVRRRDGSTGYALASVVDDAACGVTRVVRGQDLAPHETLHRALYRLLALPEPHFVHHPLLYAKDDDNKLAKFHQHAPIDPAAPPCAPQRMLGRLGRVLGLFHGVGGCDAAALLDAYREERLPRASTRLIWDEPT